MAELLRWGEHLSDPLTCLAVAQFYLGRGVVDQSLKWVDLAKAAASSSYEERELYVNLGIIYRQSGDLPQAQQVLEKALKIDPDYLPAQYNARLVQAELALGRKDWQGALEAFDALTLLEPGNPLPYYNMAVVCERLPERRIEAMDYYRLFIERAGGKYSRAVARARERIAALSSDSTVNRPRTDPLID
jgi:tetratricopeptide (TPR) repeat protein